MWKLWLACALFHLAHSASLKPAYRDVSSCPEPYGLQTYSHPKNCDQFYKCENGTLTLETCENGLLFDGHGSVHNYCNYHWAVNCEDRLYDLQEDLSSACPYSFGLFTAGPGCQTSYLRCAYGEPEEVPCEKGLAYDERTHGCNWPDELLEQGCDPAAVIGFRCPEPSSIPAGSLSRLFLPFPRFALPGGDCKHLITCVNQYPRLIGCGEQVVNENTLSCDEPENVPQCY